MHRDDRGIEAAVRAGIARAKTGPWADDAASHADLRGLLVGVCAAAALCGTVPPAKDNETTVVDVRPATRDDDRAWQAALLRGIGALGRKQQKAVDGTVTVSTINGTPLASPINTAYVLGWPGAFVVIGIVAIGAAFLYAIISQENEITATQVAVDANQQQLASELGATAEVLERHKAREATSGQSLPYDAEELRYLDTLNQAIERSAGWKPPRPKSIPDVGGVTKGINSIGEAFGMVPFLLGIAFLLDR